MSNSLLYSLQQMLPNINVRLAILPRHVWYLIKYTIQMQQTEKKIICYTQATSELEMRSKAKELRYHWIYAKSCILDLSDHQLAPQTHFLELSVCQPCCLLLQLAGSLFETMSPVVSGQHWQKLAYLDWTDLSSVKHGPSQWGSPSWAWCARCCSYDCCNKCITILHAYLAENEHEHSELSFYGTSGDM